MRTLVRFSVAVILACAFSACGRFGPVTPPELAASQPVQNLEALADLQGVKLSWKAPESDRKGRALKSLDGYQILRAERSEALRAEPPVFLEIGQVQDVWFKDLPLVQAQAEKEGRSARKIKRSSQDSTFSFVDATVETGRSYLYKVLPMAEGRVVDSLDYMISVDFKGSGSQVNNISISQDSSGDVLQLEDDSLN